MHRCPSQNYKTMIKNMECDTCHIYLGRNTRYHAFKMDISCLSINLQWHAVMSFSKTIFVGLLVFSKSL